MSSALNRVSQPRKQRISIDLSDVIRVVLVIGFASLFGTLMIITSVRILLFLSDHSNARVFFGIAGSLVLVRVITAFINFQKEFRRIDNNHNTQK